MSEEQHYEHLRHQAVEDDRSLTELGGEVIFKAVSTQEVQFLLDESIDTFLPIASKPTESTQDLFVIFQQNPSFRIYGYMVDNAPATYITSLDYKQSGVISIGPMYVGEAYRGLRLGTQQVETIVDLARQQGYSAVYTKTWGINTGARRIFETLGFKVQKVTENDRVDGDSTISYWLDI